MLVAVDSGYYVNFTRIPLILLGEDYSPVRHPNILRLATVDDPARVVCKWLKTGHLKIEGLNWSTNPKMLWL